jgi:uncharacterized protein (DUF1697 family)
MIYVALLRGINVGGKNKVEMARLKTSFEAIGLSDVRTYINSGNILFSSDKKPAVITTDIEAAIEKDFGFHVHVLLRDSTNIQALAKAVPLTQVNDTVMKTDIMFLWEDVDRKNVLQELTIKPGIDNVKYLPGAIIWNVKRDDASRSGLMKIIGTPLYKRMTIRNVNTLRKLVELMQENPTS